ncbi:putative PPE family protein PPE10 [Mycobacterium shigaense]|uniref:Putative PPE family protein PPE10 n=2 Tax=Mycobacterium shigaense TaxID=722731 RepID=A0A1Z4ECY4_9MYCO|nr:putative PPE family protein PPE10 [Mycobacterium shigaense]
MLAAAAAWYGLAENLASSATTFVSVTADLAKSSWQGPAAIAMMEVASKYTSWLSAAAAQAEATSTQASAMAAAFENAQSATVQPAVVSANRQLVQVLASTNYLGQNAPTIMDIESAYEQMWASDVAAMSDYHADASAAVAHLAPWQQVLHTLGFDFNHGQLTSGLPGATPPTGNTPLAFGGFAPADTGALTSAHDVTGGVSTASAGYSLLNPATPGTGLTPSLGHPDLLHPATYVGGMDAVAPKPAVPS